MKHILILFFIVFSTFSYSQNWEQILEAEQEEYFYKPNTRNTAWVKIISEKTEYFSEKEQKDKTVDGYKMILWKFDCRGKKIGVIQAIIYSKDGTSLESYKQNEHLVEMDYVVPETIGENLLNIFCKN